MILVLKASSHTCDLLHVPLIFISGTQQAVQVGLSPIVLLSAGVKEAACSRAGTKISTADRAAGCPGAVPHDLAIAADIHHVVQNCGHGEGDCRAWRHVRGQVRAVPEQRQ